MLERRDRQLDPRRDFNPGRIAALNFLKGQVIRLTKAKANPGLVGEILEWKLKC